MRTIFCAKISKRVNVKEELDQTGEPADVLGCSSRVSCL